MKVKQIANSTLEEQKNRTSTGNIPIKKRRRFFLRKAWHFPPVCFSVSLVFCVCVCVPRYESERASRFSQTTQRGPPRGRFWTTFAPQNVREKQTTPSSRTTLSPFLVSARPKDIYDRVARSKPPTGELALRLFQTGTLAEKKKKYKGKREAACGRLTFLSRTP